MTKKAYAIEVKKSLDRRRWENSVHRRKLKRLKRRLTQIMPVRTGVRASYRSTALRLLANRCVEPLGADPVRAGKILMPSRFSIIDNPHETLSVICRIAKCATSYARPKISLDHRATIEMDLAADTLLGITLKETKKECQGVKKMQIRGHYPRDPALRREMDEIGVTKALFSSEESWSVDLNPDLKVFRHRQVGLRIEEPLEARYPAQDQTSRFAIHVDDCLAVIGKKLTSKGRQELCVYVGEILTNAEEHPGIVDWTIVGYLDVELSWFEVAIINFGKTIADTFKELPRESYAFRQVDSYVSRIARTGANQVERDKLITVAALQSRISSKNSDERSDRGQGTVEAIEFFQQVLAECQGSERKNPNMCILSGSTFIKFDGTYRMVMDGHGRKIIAFNKQGSLFKPPDEKFVQVLPGASFPGTILAIRFPLARGAIASREV